MGESGDYKDPNLFRKLYIYSIIYYIIYIYLYPLSFKRLFIYRQYYIIQHTNYMGSPGGSDGKESTCNVGDLGSIPGLGSSPGEGNNYSLQYSGLENSMDRETWWSQRVRHDWATFTSHHFNVVYNITEKGGERKWGW